MAGLFVSCLLVGLPIVLAFLSPILLICLTLATAVLPVTLGSDGVMATDFGRLDVYSIRVLGLWLASLLLILPSFSRLLEYGNRFRWHMVFFIFVVTALLWAPSLIYGVRMVAKLTAPFLFMFLVLVVVTKQAELHLMERALLFSGVAAVVAAVGAVLAGYVKINSLVGLGIPGLGPPGTSAHLAIVAMAALAATMTRSHRLFYAMLALCFAAAVIAGFTRITIAGLFLGAGVIMWLTTPGVFRWLMPFAGVGGLAALFTFSETFRSRMFKGQQGVSLDLLASDPSAAIDQIHGSGRFEPWAFVMKTFFEPNPLVGSGVGSTQQYFYTHTVGMNVIHSEYVRLLAEVGVVGFGLFLLACATYIIRLVRIYHRAARAETKTYALAALGSLVVYLIFMATDNAIDYVMNAGIYVFGLIAMSEKSSEFEAAAEPVRSLRQDVSVAVGRMPIGARRYEILAGK